MATLISTTRRAWQQGSPWTEAAGVAAAAFILFAATMPRVITFEDAGLFDSVCYTGGIAHPPGYPLFTLICAPLFHLPLSPVIIGNSISAVFGALACGMMVAILRLTGCGRGVAIFGGALLAVTAAFWSQAIIVEVYALNAFIFLCVLYLCIRFNREPGRRLAWLICLGYSLGIANHWPLMVLAFPGLALICLARWDWIRLQLTIPRFWAMVVAMVLLGISPYATLLLKKHPLVSYSGPIDSLGGLWDYFMRKAYASVDHQAAANITDKLQYLGWISRQIAHQASPLALPLLLPALIAGHKRIGVPVQLGLVLVFIANTYGLVLLLGFDYEYHYRTIFLPYPILAWCCLVVWYALGLQWLGEHLRPVTRFAPALVAVLAVTGVSLTFAQNAPVDDRAHETLASDYAKLVLRTLGRHAAIVSWGDTDTLPLAYEHIVKGLRPDVTPLQFRNVVFPDKLPGNTGKARIAAILAMAAHRPVYTFYGIPGMPYGINHGLYQQIIPGDKQLAARDDRLAAFRHRLVRGWLTNAFHDPTVRDFVNQTLMNFTQQLLALSSQVPLNAGEARDLADLEKTFSGRLVTLAWAINHPAFRIPGQQLLNIAFAAEKHIPAEATSMNRATFHYAFALLFLSGRHGIKKDPSFARVMLLKSFQDLPTRKSPGLCKLLKLGPPRGHLAWQFADQCPGVTP